MICCYQVTKLLCSRYCSASASSAGTLVILVHKHTSIFWEVAKSTVPLFAERSGSELWRVCAGAGTSVSSRFSVNSSNHSRRPHNRSSEARLLSLFLFWFWVFGESRQFPPAGSAELKFLCSTCALLWSQRRILVPLKILKWAPALPWLQSESKKYLYPYF